MSEKRKLALNLSSSTEMNVLGAMMESIRDASIGLKLVQADDFYEPKNRIIFTALKNVIKEKSDVSNNLVLNQLKLDGNLNLLGGEREGLNYLIYLVQKVGTSTHIEAECEFLKEMSAKRELLSAVNSMSYDLANGEKISKIIEKNERVFANIKTQKAHAESSLRYLLDNNSEKKLIEDLKKVSPGVLTGFKIGEEQVKIPGGAISVIAMPTSHGKTATLINYSLGVLNHHSDKSVYFFTYEECDAMILTLFMNTYINDNLSKNNRESIRSYFVNGNSQFITPEKREIFLKNKVAFFNNLIDTGRLKVFYSDMSVEELINAIHFLKKNSNLGLVCIDYMQLLKLLNWNSGSRQEELKQICLMLKDCAVATGLPILIGAQFNRTVISEATLSPVNIGEAGDIERIANLIIGGWNRNFISFSSSGNVGRDGNKVPQENAIYFEIMKGRGIGNGHSSVINFNGNTGKLNGLNNNLKNNPIEF